MTFKQRLISVLTAMNFGEPVPKQKQLLGKVSDAIYYTQHHGNITAVIDGMSPTDWNRRVSNLLGTVIEIPHGSVESGVSIIRKCLDHSLAKRGLQVKSFFPDEVSGAIMAMMINPADNFSDASIHTTIVQIVENNNDFSITMHQYIQQYDASLYVSSVQHNVMASVSPLLTPQNLGNLRGMSHTLIDSFGKTGEVIAGSTNISIVPFLEQVWVEAIIHSLTGEKYNTSLGLDTAWKAYRSRVLSMLAIHDPAVRSANISRIIDTPQLNDDSLMKEVLGNIVNVAIMHGVAVSLVHGQELINKNAPAVGSKEVKQEAVNA